MHECRRIWDPVGPSAVQIRGPEAKTSRGRDGPSAHRTSVRAVFARRGGEGGEEENFATCTRMLYEAKLRARTQIS